MPSLNSLWGPGYRFLEPQVPHREGEGEVIGIGWLWSLNMRTHIKPLGAELCSVAQSCLMLCDPINCSLPCSSIHGMLQAGILERIAISYSRGSTWPRDWTCVSCISWFGKWIFYHWATCEAPGRASITKHMGVHNFLSLERKLWTKALWYKIAWCVQRTKGKPECPGGKEQCGML